MRPDNAPKILIVDDSASDIRILAELVGDLATLTFAMTGAEALARLADGGFDVVLLDIVLPDMSGFEVCRAVVESTRVGETSVIFVTALDDCQSEEFGLLLGAIDYVSKPFAPAAVRARVRNHLMLGRVTRELRRANQELERLATLDGLTEVFNRRHFERTTTLELERAQRYGHAGVLLAIDLDHFKSINDTHGHGAGDRVLEAAAAAWREALRAHDLIGRVGGEEFAVYLPETCADEGARVAERLVGLTRRLDVVAEDGRVLRVTASIGGAVRGGCGAGFDRLMRCADRMLYRAKEQGRDRFVMCGAAGASCEHGVPPLD